MRIKTLLITAIISAILLLVSPGGYSQTRPSTAPAVHDFSRWEKDIAAFEQADRANPPPKGGWLFTGSSTIRLWKTLAQDFPEHKVINRGFGGSHIVDATHFADRIIFPHEPSVVVIRAGGNDLWAGKPWKQVFEDFKAFADKVHARLPNTQIVFLSLSPSVARLRQAEEERAVNILVEQYAWQTPYVKFVEAYDVPLGPDGKPRSEVFVEDQLHFNEEGYKLLIARIKPQMPK